MECYRVKVPEGRRLTGSTIGGQRVSILPGEYHVHRLMAKLSTRPRAAALRFVGACKDGKDVHITVPADVDIGDALGVEVMRLPNSPPATGASLARVASWGANFAGSLARFAADRSGSAS